MDVVTLSSVLSWVVAAVALALVVAAVLLLLKGTEVPQPPAPEPPRAPPPPPPPSHPLPGGSGDPADDEITLMTLSGALLTSGFDEEQEAVLAGPAAAVPILFDPDAAGDDPTGTHAVFLVAAVGQSDHGKQRTNNEDSYLELDDHHLYAVADGMGGHAGGEIASRIAVDVLERAFREQRFEGSPYEGVPRRGSELALAIQMASRAIHARAAEDPALRGMGTTLVSARFTPDKERVYIGHVGDSRCYRLRAGQLTQLTTDHTMGALGVRGPTAEYLSRAVGVSPSVKVDLVIARPRLDDLFLLCSDGLSKMLTDEAIADILVSRLDPREVVQALVRRANEAGGRDNVTVIVVAVKHPSGWVPRRA